MAVLKVSALKLHCLLDKLMGVIDFNKDLPMNVFVSGGFIFWFFERPLLSFVDIFSGLISESFSSFESDVFIKFSGCGLLADSCFSISRNDVDSDALWISKKSEDFFCGKFGYPIILFNEACDWIAFESAREEFGVIAVRAPILQDSFFQYLESQFISSNELTELASGASADSAIAKAFVSSYCS